MPCCVKQNIPEVCRSVCSGDYGLTTVRQHYSCMDYTIPTLSCIAEGIGKCCYFGISIHFNKNKISIFQSKTETCSFPLRVTVWKSVRHQTGKVFHLVCSNVLLGQNRLKLLPKDWMRALSSFVEIWKQLYKRGI